MRETNHGAGELILDFKTETCSFVRPTSQGLQTSMSWQEYLDRLTEKQVLYYIDAERVLQETKLDTIREKLAQADPYNFRFRVNGKKHFEWYTATVRSYEKSGGAILSAKITVESQNIFSIQDLISSKDFLHEVLFKGFGRRYFNLIWIDVNNNRYKIINQFGNAIDLEVNTEPLGVYVDDNKGYAHNFVYQEDWDTFWRYTSLEWYQEHLNREGDHYSFLLRHIYNGEYRWVEVTTICTKRTADDFHVLYWVDDVNDKVYDNTAMKDTLASVEVGQWRYEVRNGSEKLFTASPSLMRILGLRENAESEALLNDLRGRLHPEDREKVGSRIFALAANEETSFTFRLSGKDKGWRYYRCGVTCVAKNEIYTCFQGYGQDVTDIMQPMISSIRHAEELSFTDTLTGLNNRNYMEAYEEQFILADALPISFILADCNYLKRTNDTLGHQYGDRLLQRVAQSIRACLPEAATAMRIGGDEFLILCPHCPAPQAEQLVAAIRQRLHAASDAVLPLSASFGTCTVEDAATSFREAYAAADYAMYEEKEQYHRENP